MRLLLDTHVALWALSAPERLSEGARDAIVSAEDLWLSVVSPWEMVIKASLGKLELHRPVADLVRELEREFGVVSLPIKLPHVLEVAHLPLHHPEHGDPFDRLLIGQARAEGLSVVTRDRHFEAYGVPVIAA